MTAQRVTIERLVAGGDALAHLEDGRVVFVEGALPGEVVDVEIVQSKKDFARATVGSIVTPSAHRITPPCPNVARGCGGCSWQHLDHAVHGETKIELVTEALRRTAHLEGIELRFGGALPPRASRTTLRMAVDEHGRLGFRKSHSHDIVPVEECLVAHEMLVELLADARVEGASEVTMRCGVASGERGVWLHDDKGRDAKGATITGLPRDVKIGRRAVVHETVHGVNLQVSMPAFFQTSAIAAELLVNAVNTAAGDAALSGDFGPIVDAYGGGGLFSATLVDTDVDIVLVESNKAACNDAHVNLVDHQVRIEQIAVEQWQPIEAGLVIADPARNGLGRVGAETIVATEAPRIVLVSCDAVAGARDIRLLMDAGYSCESVTVLDLFPHTPHVEVVTALSRVSN
ncbi:MAG: hypothetical protein RIS58_265 [Actinomycetota bacterium]